MSLRGDTPSRDCAIGWWDDGYSDTSVLIKLALNDGVDPHVLLTTNPTQFPDENPFVNKGYESIPTRQDIADYADGLVDPRRINATNAKKK